MGLKDTTVERDSPSETPPNLWSRIRNLVDAFGDPRLTLLNRAALWFSFLMLGLSLIRLASGNWGNFSRHGGYHLFVIIWMALVTYVLRTVGTREIIRFWLMGFFPVALIIYFVTEPLESLIGVGNVQTAVWVPLAEELIKIAPLILWAIRARPRLLHGTLTDFLILGFAIGTGFSFHEDALYERVVATGFTSGFFGKLFPIFLNSGQYVITHAGWAAIGAVGVGIISLYWRRRWVWAIGAALILVPIIDHMAVNWRGGGSDVMLTLTGHGHTAGRILLVVLIGVIAHDVWMLQWAASRDSWFPPATIRGDVEALVGGGDLASRIRRLFSRQRYRRRRNAVFADLYSVRSRGEPAGDRAEVVFGLTVLAYKAQIPQQR